jgi:surface polysaccharide O-acyltransferase-like enzyme
MSEQSTNNPSPTPKAPPAPWPDRLRNLATVMVIGIHVAAPIAHGEGQDFNGTWWWAGNFWNSLTRPAVPLFVMLSGYLLLGKDYPLPDFLKRRFSRVVIPAIFWMLIYCFYGYMANGSPRPSARP